MRNNASKSGIVLLESKGRKLKETGTSHWKNPNTGATNITGFNALPAGGRNEQGELFRQLGEYASFWTTTEYIPYAVWLRSLGYNTSQIDRIVYYKQIGLSVRCVKD